MITRNFKCSKCGQKGRVTLTQLGKEVTVRCYGTPKEACGHDNTFCIVDRARYAVRPMAPR